MVEDPLNSNRQLVKKCRGSENEWKALVYVPTALSLDGEEVLVFCPDGHLPKGIFKADFSHERVVATCVDDGNGKINDVVV